MGGDRVLVYFILEEYRPLRLAALRPPVREIVHEEHGLITNHLHLLHLLQPLLDLDELLLALLKALCSPTGQLRFPITLVTAA